ncbi:hypothetical protein OG357_22980 [Streptomyces sp. NBC_01255]|uniref:hypothetical protein n=1 Tax=Streptomyces sp. NBC_01255 TaxID=2903798 RepID=UPI002E35FB7D|nr:hypothetical protein [Streptomyces sp. NBC_01255]
MRAPLPPFPHWTGAHVVISTRRPLPTDLGASRRELHVIVAARVTYRARLWAMWRALTRGEVSS